MAMAQLLIALSAVVRSGTERMNGRSIAGLRLGERLFDVKTVDFMA
jgi:hypothetical protein